MRTPSGSCGARGLVDREKNRRTASTSTSGRALLYQDIASGAMRARRPQPADSADHPLVDAAPRPLLCARPRPIAAAAMICTLDESAVASVNISTDSAMTQPAPAAG